MTFTQRTYKKLKICELQFLYTYFVKPQIGALALECDFGSIFSPLRILNDCRSQTQCQLIDCGSSTAATALIANRRGVR